ncbi:hypothetical protein [Streptomyces sp. VRA16 Mangrove soil]|uniref:hypothetical protein n=1 Tax=Streptomyces sp. VRA16 Mangrove soil TaxID=2817434 RepID=UPI001A9E8EDE|nr:hypothetical protein [Streptomyces sp. VRA16 Mangrove soil]MBO1330145.1 hypothetical protein [Streptomyces sp. VRA16 Mangrove soil]
MTLRIALGQVLAGPAAARAAPRHLLLVSAGVCLVGRAALWATPAVRKLRRAAPAQAAQSSSP